MYGVIFIKEEVPIRPEEEIKHCCSDMFNVAAVKNIFETIWIERPGKCRRWMHIMLITSKLIFNIKVEYHYSRYLFYSLPSHFCNDGLPPDFLPVYQG